MERQAPTGCVTLMFTDIEGSSALWERAGEDFRRALERHNELVRRALERWEGYEVKTQGDSFMSAFQRATDAVQCAAELQRALQAEPWPDAVGQVLVRIGIHTGEPFLGYDADGRPDYFGPAVNRAARVADAAHGGQILLSGATQLVIEGALSCDLQPRDLGRHRLRGLEQEVKRLEAQEAQGVHGKARAALAGQSLSEFLLGSPTGARVSERISDPDDSLHAPHLVDLEVVQGLWEFVRTGDITRVEATRAIDHLRELDLERHPHDLFLARIWELRPNVTAHDAS